MWTPGRGLLPFALVGGAIFWIAYDDGSYSLASRGTIAIAIWWGIAVAVMFGFVRWTSIDTIALATGGLIAGLAAWTFASTFWSPSAEAAFSEFNRTTLYLGVYVIVVLAASRRDVGTWCNALALAIVSVACVALVSRLFPDVFSDRGLAVFLTSSAPRLSFPLGYWNGLGVFTALGVPLLLRSAIAGTGPATRSLALAPVPVFAAVIYLTSSRAGVLTAFLGVVVFVVLTERRWSAVGAVVVSCAGAAGAIAVLLPRDELVNGPLGTQLVRAQGHEAALLIALVCIATAAVSWLTIRLPRGRFRPSPWFGRILASVVVVALVGVALASHPVARLREFRQSPAELETLEPGDFVQAHLLSGRGNGRWQWWSVAVDSWKEHPLRGLGAGSYEQWWSEHASFTYFVRDAHSLYVEVLGELGVVGLALVVALVLIGLVEGARRALGADGDMRVGAAALTASFAGYAVAAGVDWMWELTVVSVAGFVLLALLTGPATRAIRSARLAEQDERLPRAGRWRFGIGVATLLVAWALIGAQLIPLLAQRAIARSEAAARRGDLADAEGQATAARHIQPWAASPYLQLALVDERRGDLGEARIRIDQAIGRDPRNWRLWLTAARLDTKLGDAEQAERSLRRAIALNPRSPLFEGLLNDGTG
jgi:O-Antigen ligase/Tetratricopeptide repeat